MRGKLREGVVEGWKRRGRMGYLDAQAGEEGRTAFRKAEKKYKLYKRSTSHAHRSSLANARVPGTDLSEVLDFRMISEAMSHGGSNVEEGVKKMDIGFDWPVLTLDRHPGFFFIPAALTVEEQMYWIQESLLNFPQPPNRTNHTAFHGHINDLWTRAQNEQFLVCKKSTTTHNPNPELDLGKDSNNKCIDYGNCKSEGGEKNCTVVNSGESQPESDPVCRLEKTTQSQSEGNENCDDRFMTKENAHKLVEKDCSSDEKLDSFEKIIPASSLLRKLRWATLGLQFDWSKRAYNVSLPHNEIPPKLSELACKLAKPAMGSGEFHAEAAIVNYFGCSDMLGGHLDDMEADLSRPIVSISLGCKAIFLLGGTSRDDNPVAMYLRSGDVILMSGPSRLCFHGVPRIFVNPEEAELPDYTDFTSFGPFLDYIKESRVNINIRQVY